MAAVTEQAQEHLAEKPEPLPNGSTNGNDKPQSPPDFGGRFDAPPAAAAAEYRPPYKPAYGPQRFMSGQSLSQAAGPTPTLNQLLQNNPPRPNYDNPQWQARPPFGYHQGPYRPPHPQQQPQQRPYLAGPGAPQQGPQYPPYPQRYPTPPGPGRPQQQPQQPYQPPPHQMPGAPYGSQMYGDGRGPQWGPQQQAPPQQQQPPQPQQSPVPPQGPGTPTPPQQQQQQYPPRPGQPATPNAHPPPDAGDQNSNDSSSGHGAAPGTPNSQQGLSSRPTPSPTGSTGSRSMSPAVQGQQQNIPIPPRPSSGQSEAPAARMSHSPIQAGYQPPYPKQAPYPQQYPPQQAAPQQPPPPPQQQQQPQPPPQQPPYAARPYYPPGPGPQYRANHQNQPQQQPPPGQYYPGWKQGGGQQPPPQRPHTPPNYLKQHLQNKMNFGYGGMGPPQQQQPQPMGPPPMVVSAPTVAPPPGPDESNGATSVITTGPDGTPLDDASQQSTLSNASAASNEDSGTPKRASKQEQLQPPQHQPPQQFQSPGVNSMHDDSFGEPPGNWPRTPASPPTNNNNIPSGPGNSNESSSSSTGPDKRLTQRRRLQKPDSMSKLYEMDENPERRPWLDKLLQFMEERNTPINACPTISKNTLDLFRLYYMVKERNGFMEVTKAKTWKDIAILLNVGSSSSAAYTLRKHYTKHLLPFECHFDRGGIDPQPIISQVEASTKKKPKPTSVPSPGSSNSQDSFPPPGSGSASMDGYGGAYPAYPPSGSSSGPGDFGSQQQAPRPSSTGDNVSASNPFDDPPPRHPHSSSSYGPPPPPPRGYQQQPGGYYDQQQYQRPPDFGQPQFGPGGQYQPRPMYPPYDAERAAYQQDPYQRWPSPAGYPPRPYPASPQQQQPQPPVPQPPSVAQPGQPPAPPVPAAVGVQPPAQPPQPQGFQQDAFYRPDQPYPQPPPPPQQPPPQQYPPGSPGAPNKTVMPPPQQPRRHPDFNKEQQPPPQQPYFGHQRPYAWSGQNSQFRPPPPGSFSGQQPPPGQWSQQPRGPQWDRFPPNAQGFQQPPQGQQWIQGSNMPMRPQRPAFRGPDQKAYPPVMMGGKPMQPFPPGQHKREHTFPPDSVEAALPVLYKRRRVGKADVAPVDAWRLMMSLKSGLLAESCWALDVLNVLLFDDQSVAYFGLNNLPGMLDVLLEHLRKSLADMFDESEEDANHNKKWYEAATREAKDVDLGCARPVDLNERVQVLSGRNGQNYSLVTRKGEKVSVIARDSDPFVDDSRRPWDDEEATEDALLRAPPGTGTVAGDGGDGMRYITGCFRAEFGNVPFVRLMPGEAKEKPPATPLQDPEPPPLSAEQIKQEEEEVETEKAATAKEEEEAEARAAEESTPTARLEVRDPAGSLKRKRMEDYEDEAYTRDEASLCVVSESQEGVARRCLCVLNVLRSLSFIPGNELELARSNAFLQLLGKLVALHHEHPPRPPRVRANYDRDDSDAECGADASCSSLAGEQEWWWSELHVIREAVLVMIANISGYLDLGQHPEDVSRPILDGLLHWVVCPAAYGQDSFPVSQLSPQRLALEALCKLCVTEANVDLLLATPPHSRLERLCSTLAKMLCRSEEQPLREFAVNMLHSLAAAASSAARIVAMQAPTVSLLLGFIEQAEQSALGVANQHGIQALRDNPEAMGTSLDMLRRAAATLLHLSRHRANRPLFVQQEQRLLTLVMSQILDQHVAAILARVLYQCSRAAECS
ncbi:trithorax group protein osa isoform X2 [Cloeon dipterum]|uniref:trithorax group protein osa isoform X2 n=1 Tax=Cloeon dipterum TaxID=197152 RepID=UPI00321F6FD6